MADLIRGTALKIPQTRRPSAALKFNILTEPGSYPSDPVEDDFDLDAMKAQLEIAFDPKYIALTKEKVSMKKNDAVQDEQDFLRKMLVKKHSGRNKKTLISECPK